MSIRNRLLISFACIAVLMGLVGMLLRSSGLTALVVMLVAMGIALLVGWGVSSHIGRPLALLSAASLRVGRGELETEVLVSRNDEIGQLVRSFNAMVQKLKFTTTSVEALNQEIEVREAVQKSLEETRDFLQLVIDGIPDPLMVIDRDYRIIMANKVTREWSDGRDPVTGSMKCHQLTHQREAPCTGGKEPCPLALVVASKKPVTVMHTHYGMEGREIKVEVTAAPIFDESGEVVQIIETTRDITDRLKREQELRKTNWLLKEQTSKAESASLAMSEFLASMSCEIRTPMNGVLGMITLLQDSDLTETQRDYVQRVESSGRALLNLINDVLDFSKMEAGKLTMESLEFDLRTTLEDLNEWLTVLSLEKDLAYVCLIEPDVPCLLRGDPGRLRQVITNLVGNAIKFTPKGEVRLYVTVDEESRSEIRLHFSIKDTGIGISTDVQDGLFEAFSQADATTSRRYGRTGLGLTISRNLVQMMKGQIGVESSEGTGATFWFTAVFQKQPDITRSIPALPEDISGRRVLLVDSDDTNRALLEGQLLEWGCKCESVSDADSALARLRVASGTDDALDVAIIDMQLPDLSGEDLGIAINQDPTIGDIRLILMTSIGLRGDASRARSIGFSGYITKPVGQEQFHDCLRTTLAHLPTGGKVAGSALVTRHHLSDLSKQKVNILLAEDNSTNTIVATKILQKLGYQVEAVTDGAEALRALETFPYDLVLMDIQMPEMDGYQATEQIRKKHATVLNPRIKIIAMTAHAMAGDREKCLAAGMDDYVSKPIDASELSAVIVRQLRHSESDPDQSITTNTHGTIAHPTTAKGFDPCALIERFEGDADLVRNILDVFLDDAPRQIEHLQSALDNRDADAVVHYSHTLKGAAMNVGASALSDLARRAEKAGEVGDLVDADELIREMGKTFTELQALLGDMPVITDR